MIIDTNVYSALDAGSVAASLAIKSAKVLYIPIVVVAELKYGFINGRNRIENEKNLNRFIAQPGVEILYLTSETPDIYAQLATYCKKSGRAIVNNDLWIASLSIENDLPLATYDKDFMGIAELLGNRLKLLKN